MPLFPTPSESRLEALLRDAYEFMPGPDMARLGEIGSRLLRAARRPAARRRAPLPWWVILLLAGGAATAAWWAGERWLDPRAKIREELTVAPGAPSGETPPAGDPPANRVLDRSGAGSAERQDERSPIIDRREEP